MHLFLPYLIVFCIWLNYKFKKSSSHAEQSRQNRLELEREANSTRKKSIDTLHYITFSEKSIPIIEINDELTQKYQKSLLNFVDKRIVNLSSMTNTELKKAYGPANLPALSEYDANFSELIRILHNYALRLHELDYNDEAKAVLEYSVKIGTDMGITYKLLADFYHAHYRIDKIEELLPYTKHINPLTRDSVISYLNSYIN